MEGKNQPYVSELWYLVGSSTRVGECQSLGAAIRFAACPPADLRAPGGSSVCCQNPSPVFINCGAGFHISEDGLFFFLSSPPSSFLGWVHRVWSNLQSPSIYLGKGKGVLCMYIHVLQDP